jgi:hypothetical protein
LVGTLGLTANEVKSVTKSYNDSMLTTANQAEIASIDHTNELMKSTRALKTFAMATGQSVENILKEQKERERTWQMQRLASDPRTRNQLMMMRNAGLSDELIEGIMLGKHNKATTMAMLDPNSAAMMQQMRRAYMTTMGDPEAFAKAMMSMSNSAAAQGMRQSEANMNVMDYAYINGLGELFAPGSTIWGKMTAQTFGNNSNELMSGTEVEGINAMQELSSSINGLKNNIVDALSPAIKTITGYIQPGSPIHTAITGLAKWVGENPMGTLFAFAGIVFAKNFVGTAFSSWVQGKIFQKMGIGVGTAAAEEIGKKATMWSKVGGIIGKSIGVIGGHLLATSIGSAIGGGIGSLFGNSEAGSIWGRYIGAAVNGAIWGIKGGPWGALAGAIAGIAIEAGKDLISNFFGSSNEEEKTTTVTKNAPSEASNTSAYNTQYVNDEQQSSGGIAQPATVNTTHNSVSVIGMESLRSLIRENNNILKDVYAELRTGPMKTGTNLVG